MKFINAKTIAAVALTGALSAGSVSAAGLDAGVQSLNSITGVSSANIKVLVDDGVATLFGYVDSNAEAALAEAHVEKLDGVDQVINRIVKH